jgi:hypothetical protein
VTCPKCQTAVPERSVFCLACGARLAPGPSAQDGNGSAAVVARAPAPAGSAAAVGAAPAPVAAPPAPTPGVKQAYALSFRPLVDERLRYRVARWVVERAPAHSLTEVQAGLQDGTFLTFLALTPEEAEAARDGIQALGVAAPLVQLAPATAAQLMLPRPVRPKAGERRTLGGREWAGIAAAVVGLLLFGLILVRLFGDRGF